jgi:hypothetical protein
VEADKGGALGFGGGALCEFEDFGTVVALRPEDLEGFEDVFAVNDDGVLDKFVMDGGVGVPRRLSKGRSERVRKVQGIKSSRYTYCSITKVMLGYSHQNQAPRQ